MLCARQQNTSRDKVNNRIFGELSAVGQQEVVQDLLKRVTNL
ncbi:MAG: hypothetical protein UT05_C0001G0007 [Parcubacteria group bacterium GW2011_GWF2_38_76]|nr:MAG: hypothetical protein UT05_C0001G0007 [Parcubacteria group bacterium GW2011_GWF2_38_76]